MFTFSYFRKNPGFLAGTFKSAKSTIKRFALLNFDLRHLYPSLPIRLMGCCCTLINYKIQTLFCQFHFITEKHCKRENTLFRAEGRISSAEPGRKPASGKAGPWKTFPFRKKGTGRVSPPIPSVCFFIFCTVPWPEWLFHRSHELLHALFPHLRQGYGQARGCLSVHDSVPESEPARPPPDPPHPF